MHSRTAQDLLRPHSRNLGTSLHASPSTSQATGVLGRAQNTEMWGGVSGPQGRAGQVPLFLKECCIPQELLPIICVTPGTTLAPPDLLP